MGFSSVVEFKGVGLSVKMYFEAQTKNEKGKARSLIVSLCV